jgi:DNA-binding transcriptional MerR regulator
MRISEIAALVGVSTRTVRYYHRLGLLPEPPRRANGYREYGLRDAVDLARVRRLAGLGVPLERVRAVLESERDRDLREALRDLDADLARQQREITDRRARLAALLADPELDPDTTVSPDMARVLRGLPRGSAFAAHDQRVLALMDTAAHPDDRAGLADLFGPFTRPEAAVDGLGLYARLDALADAAPDDPRVPALAADLADHMPEAMADAMVEALEEDGPWARVLTRELPAAQAATLRRVVVLLRARA